MKWIIETTTQPDALGAGTHAEHVRDYRHAFTLTGPDGIEARGLSTGSDDKVILPWAIAAHGFTHIEFEKFDGRAEAKRREEVVADTQAQIDKEAAELAASEKAARAEKRKTKVPTPRRKSTAKVGSRTEVAK